MNVPVSVHNANIILRAGLQILRRNPQLLWFPLLSLAGTFVAGIACVLLFKASVMGEPPPPSGAASVSSLVFALCSQICVLLGAVALAHASSEAFAGRPFTVRGSVEMARTRLSAIATYAVLQAGIGRLLRRRPRSAAGNFARGTWSAATYLVVPVLAREQQTGWDSIKRSTQLLHSTWQEALVGRVVLARLWIPLVVALLLPLGLCALIGVDEPAVLLAAIGVPAIGGSVASLVLYTLDIMYRTALYVYATEGVVPEPYDHPDLHDIWHTRPASNET